MPTHRIRLFCDVTFFAGEIQKVAAKLCHITPKNLQGKGQQA